MPPLISRSVPSDRARGGGLGGSEPGPFCRLVLWLARRDRSGRWTAGSPSPAALQEHVRLLWSAGRPVLYLAALCTLAALPLGAVAPQLGLVFWAAGVGAVALFFWMVRDASVAAGVPGGWAAETGG